MVALGVGGVFSSPMESQEHVSPPDPLSEAAGPSGSQPSIDTLTATLESFVSRAEVALGRLTSKKHPPPVPASSVSSDPESDSAAVDGAHPAGPAAALLDFFGQ